MRADETKLILFYLDLVKVFLLSRSIISSLSLLLLAFKFSSPSHFYLSLPTLCPRRAHCMIRNMLIIAKWAIVAKDVCRNKHFTADVGTDTLTSQQRYLAVSFERGDNGSWKSQTQPVIHCAYVCVFIYLWILAIAVGFYVCQ